MVTKKKKTSSTQSELQSKAPIQIQKTPRIQTAEGWKRSQLKKRKLSKVETKR